jgi:hypothetical protein
MTHTYDLVFVSASASTDCLGPDLELDFDL